MIGVVVLAGRQRSRSLASSISLHYLMINLTCTVPVPHHNLNTLGPYFGLWIPLQFPELRSFFLIFLPIRKIIYSKESTQSKYKPYCVYMYIYQPRGEKGCFEMSNLYIAENQIESTTRPIRGISIFRKVCLFTHVSQFKDLVGISEENF